MTGEPQLRWACRIPALLDPEKCSGKSALARRDPSVMSGSGIRHPANGHLREAHRRPP
jgi:hypothetical protein